MSDAWVVAEAPDYHLEHMMDHMVRFNNMRTNRIGSHPIGALYMKESGAPAIAIPASPTARSRAVRLPGLYRHRRRHEAERCACHGYTGIADGMS